MYKGRITGKSVLNIEFRSFYSEILSLGDILVAEDAENKTKYFLRIVDIKYGVEASDPDWPNRTAGNMMLMDSMEQPFGLHDKERRLYKIGQCVPLGCIKNGVFRKAKSLPSHFSKVSSPTEKDFDFLKEFMGDIEVGNLRSGEGILDFNVGIKGSLFPYHVGVFATTGMGKSNLMKVLAGSTLLSGKHGMLIFDPHGEYYDGGGDSKRKGLIDAPLAEKRLKVYSTRTLSGPYNQLKVSAQEVRIDDLQQIYNFSGPQTEALYSITYHYKKDWLIKLATEEPEEILETIGANAFQIGTVSVLKRRAKHIIRLSFIHGDQTVSITKNILSDLRNGHLVLVDTSNMRQDEELLTSAIITRAVFEANKEAYQKPNLFKKVPPTLIVLEEAQRVLGKESERNLGIFAQIAREGRKFKTGLCAITQQPKLVDEELLSQFNTLFILGLADERDRSILRNSAKHDISALGNEIQTLMAGEALITAPENPFALPAKIFLYEEWIKLIGSRESGVGSQKQKIETDEGFF
ncbi:MAG TPA: ATP-binding protein [Actinobacteria bacterium]|nr:ATP-binding protein [Actinomycetota bacterium]